MTIEIAEALIKLGISGALVWLLYVAINKFFDFLSKKQDTDVEIANKSNKKFDNLVSRIENLISVSTERTDRLIDKITDLTDKVGFSATTNITNVAKVEKELDKHYDLLCDIDSKITIVKERGVNYEGENQKSIVHNCNCGASVHNTEEQ